MIYHYEVMYVIIFCSMTVNCNCHITAFYKRHRTNSFFLLFSKCGYALLVVFPFISMIILELLLTSRLLKGRTLTATFTEDIVPEKYSVR